MPSPAPPLSGSQQPPLPRGEPPPLLPMPVVSGGPYHSRPPPRARTDPLGCRSSFRGGTPPIPAQENGPRDWEGASARPSREARWAGCPGGDVWRRLRASGRRVPGWCTETGLRGARGAGGRGGSDAAANKMDLAANFCQPRRLPTGGSNEMNHSPAHADRTAINAVSEEQGLREGRKCQYQTRCCRQEAGSGCGAGAGTALGKDLRVRPAWLGAGAST